MWRRWGLLCLLLMTDRVSALGVRPQGLRDLQEDEDLKNSIIEEALMFLEENMSIETEPPSKPPVERPSPVPVVPTPSPVTPTATPTESPVETPAPVETLPPVEPVPTPSPSDVIIPTIAPIEIPAPTTTPVVLPTTPPPSVETVVPSPSPSASPSEVASPAPTTTCNLSDEEREMLIMSLLEEVSNDGSLEVEGSPQNLAADWLINQDVESLCPQDPTLIQRYSIAVFYYSTDGKGWFECSAPSNFSSQEAIAEANANCNILTDGGGGTDAWLTPSSECDWGGVACTASGFIEKIDFERNGIGGSLPSEISRFNELKYLLLEEGLISGTIPEDIGFNTKLLEIDLNFNALNGPLPETIFRLSNLEQLDLNDNQFTGTISTNISMLKQLVFLQLEQNNFRGMIPEELGNLFLLEVATLENNQLSGTMPELVCANRTGLLQVLTADCLGAPNRPSPPFVQCDCCTQCF